ncbi:MAG: sugar transferase, partial [Solirubrobacteraceae bacterium]
MVLWIAELVLAFVVVCLMAAPGLWTSIPHAWPGGVSGGVLDHAAFLAVTLGATAGAIGLYRPENCLAPRRVASHAAIVALLAFPVALLIGTVFDTRGIGSDAVWLAKVLALWIACVLASRWLLRAPLSRALRPRSIAVVGSAEASAHLRAALRSRRGALFEVGRVLAPDARAPSPEELRRSGVWAVVAPEAADPSVCDWLVDYRLRGFRVFHEAGFCEQMLGRISLDLLRPSWFLDPTGFETGTVSLRLKRLSDIAVSLLLLALSLPVMALAMAAIRLDSHGPIFYHQERVGQGGSPFVLLKFRSMVADAEKAGHPVWAAKRDPRVTRAGAIMRMTRIDELPQLWNVLRGDMSLVGPRPER